MFNNSELARSHTLNAYYQDDKDVAKFCHVLRTNNSHI